MRTSGDRRHTLARFPVVSTTDLGEARDAVTRIYLPHSLEPSSPNLAMQLNAAHQKRFTLGFLAYGAPTELRMPATETNYQELDRPGGIADAPLAREQLEAFVMTQLLLAVAYLRRIRLDHVHVELLRGLPPDVRIGDDAMRWGFYHPSRFARQYQERFGELPSETVGRTT